MWSGELIREVSAGPEGRCRALPCLSIVGRRFHTSSLVGMHIKFSRTRKLEIGYFESPRLLQFPSWKCHEKCELWSPVFSDASAYPTDTDLWLANTLVYLYLALILGGETSDKCAALCHF